MNFKYNAHATALSLHKLYEIYDINEILELLLLFYSEHIIIFDFIYMFIDQLILINCFNQSSILCKSTLYANDIPCFK